MGLIGKVVLIARFDNPMSLIIQSERDMCTSHDLARFKNQITFSFAQAKFQFVG